MSEFEEALERIVAGPERKSADHLRRGEGDHRLPRGRSRGRPADPAEVRPGRQGHDHQPRHGPRLHDGPADEDRYLQSKTEFEDKIAGLLGGNAAERLIFGDTTTGASNDIEKATDLARRMVTEFGMSDKLGPLSFGKRDELVFLGREIGEQRNYSDEVAKTDRRGGPRDHRPGLRAGDGGADDHRDKLTALAEKLVAEETVDTEGFEALFSDLPPKENSHGDARGRRRARPARPGQPAAEPLSRPDPAVATSERTPAGVRGSDSDRRQERYRCPRRPRRPPSRPSRRAPGGPLESLQGVPADPEHLGACRSTPADVPAGRGVARRALTRAGLEHVEVAETGGHPIVYGDWLHAAGRPDGPRLRPLRRPAGRPARPVDVAAVRAGRRRATGSSAAAPPTTRARSMLHLWRAEALLATRGGAADQPQVRVRGRGGIGLGAASTRG